MGFNHLTHNRPAEHPHVIAAEINSIALSMRCTFRGDTLRRLATQRDDCAPVNVGRLKSPRRGSRSRSWRRSNRWGHPRQQTSEVLSALDGAGRGVIGVSAHRRSGLVDRHGATPTANDVAARGPLMVSLERLSLSSIASARVRRLVAYRPRAHFLPVGSPSDRTAAA